ncbi:hypothetical protein [Kitasatospora sp. GP82]|uniref:hypothetical protein n=1 Tax=Kitasatospora sp. GP82 TaxID=3035089 RepID=UPI0024772838|nr:hypothetical protein [Kitasatospora sp. GP82]MDH6129385.1 hypothetical protein [Kitasatospora sp. GP82]
MSDLVNAAVQLAAVPATSMHGSGLGAITTAGLAGVGTVVQIAILKNGANPRIAGKLKWEHLAIAGYVNATLYGTAGWAGPSDAINSMTAPLAVSWGSGCVALAITGVLWLRTHGKWRASILGFTAGVLYKAADGWWSIGTMAITYLADHLPHLGH